MKRVIVVFKPLKSDNPAKTQILFNQVHKIFNSWGYPQNCGTVWAIIFLSESPISIYQLGFMSQLSIKDLRLALDFLKEKALVHPLENEEFFECPPQALKALKKQVLRDQIKLANEIQKSVDDLVETPHRRGTLSKKRLKAFGDFNEQIKSSLKLAAIVGGIKPNIN